MVRSEELGLIANEENVVKVAIKITGDVKLNIRRIIELADVTNTVYFDNTLSVELQSEEAADIKLVRLNLFDRHNAYLYLSFKKNALSRNTWKGCKIGVYGDLVDLLKNDVSVDVQKVIQTNKAYEAIYDNLYDKEVWLDNMQEMKYHRLNNFIMGLLKRIEYLSEKDINQKNLYMLESVDKLFVVINTGLLDKFCNPLRLLFRTDRDGYFEPRCVDSNSQLAQLGFNRFDVQVVSFIDSVNDVIFDRTATLLDFDFSDNHRLTHTLMERSNRLLSSKVRQPNEMLSIIKTSIEHALKISKCDYNHILPQYNIRNNKLQFLIPVYTDLDFNELPSGALVVERVGNYWSLLTLLGLEEAYKNARLVNRIGDVWLTKLIV